jgi:hypothetical protein
MLLWVVSTLFRVNCLQAVSYWLRNSAFCGEIRWNTRFGERCIQRMTVTYLTVASRIISFSRFSTVNGLLKKYPWI